MGRLSREEKEKQARESLQRRERRVKKLLEKAHELEQQLKQTRIRLKKAHQKARGAKAQVILTFLCSGWAWIGERTGTIVRTGTKRVLVDYGDRGLLWVYAYELTEGEGNRDETQAKLAGEIGRVLDDME